MVIVLNNKESAIISFYQSHIVILFAHANRKVTLEADVKVTKDVIEGLYSALRYL